MDRQLRHGAEHRGQQSGDQRECHRRQMSIGAAGRSGVNPSGYPGGEGAAAPAALGTGRRSEWDSQAMADPGQERSGRRAEEHRQDHQL
ncbi:hypothetical protein Ait01nite_050760 [Actinoplanes italicus]|nr:hypothetical protein Ait01nite_050760 [Actinoplanes italicus]